jgi:hypothetical protein
MWATENLVFSFDISPPIIFKRHAKSVGVILIKFLNPDLSSNFRVSKRSSPSLCPPANITDASTNVWAFCFYCVHRAIQGTRTLRQELTPVTRRREITPDRPARYGHGSLYRGNVRAVPQQWIGATEIQPRNKESQHWIPVCTRHYRSKKLIRCVLTDQANDLDRRTMRVWFPVAARLLSATAWRQATETPIQWVPERKADRPPSTNAANKRLYDVVFN